VTCRQDVDGYPVREDDERIAALGQLEIGHDLQPLLHVDLQGSHRTVDVLRDSMTLHVDQDGDATYGRVGQALELPADVVQSIDDAGKDTTDIVEYSTLTRHAAA